LRDLKNERYVCVGEMRWRVCGGCEDDGHGDGAADDGNDGHLAHESARKAPRNNAPRIISMRTQLAFKSKYNKNCNDKHDPCDSRVKRAGWVGEGEARGGGR
jgi:hypothetical protein